MKKNNTAKATVASKSQKSYSPTKCKSGWYGVCDITSEYYAQIATSTYNQIAAGKYQRGWLELKNVHWLVEEEMQPQSLAGHSWGYKDTMLLNMRHVSRIIPITDEYISTKFKTAQRPNNHPTG